MKKYCYMIISVLILIVIQSEVQGQLFDSPRRGGFKFIKNDNFDITNAQHFVGSGIVAVGFYKLFKPLSMSHPKVAAGLVTSFLGLLKEYEDGHREGFGKKDAIFNQIGIVTFLLLSEYSNYTLTYEQIISSPNNLGLGIRFFRTADFTPLKTSIGLFIYYDNYDDTWLGVDTHLLLLSRTELHIGLSIVKLADPNHAYIRPNIGVGFKLF